MVIKQEIRSLVGLAAVFMIAALFPVFSNATPWEESRRPSTEMRDQPTAQISTASQANMPQLIESEDVEIYVKDGWIYITTPKSISVKIFTILGQLISQKNIPAGTWREHVGTRGIYLLRAGQTTRRITL